MFPLGIFEFNNSFNITTKLELDVLKEAQDGPGANWITYQSTIRVICSFVSDPGKYIELPKWIRNRFCFVPISNPRFFLFTHSKTSDGNWRGKSFVSVVMTGNWRVLLWHKSVLLSLKHNTLYWRTKWWHPVVTHHHLRRRHWMIKLTRQPDNFLTDIRWMLVGPF